MGNEAIIKLNYVCFTNAYIRLELALFPSKRRHFTCSCRVEEFFSIVTEEPKYAENSTGEVRLLFL